MDSFAEDYDPRHDVKCDSCLTADPDLKFVFVLIGRTPTRLLLCSGCMAERMTDFIASLPPDARIAWWQEYIKALPAPKVPKATQQLPLPEMADAPKRRGRAKKEEPVAA